MSQGIIDVTNTTGVLYFQAVYEVGDLSEWAGHVLAGTNTGNYTTWGHSVVTNVAAGATNTPNTGFSTPTLTAPSTARVGTRMAQLVVDGPATFVGNAGGQRAELDALHPQFDGDDMYIGISTWVPSGSPNATTGFRNYAIWQFGSGTCVEMSMFGVSDTPALHYVIVNSAHLTGGFNTTHDVGAILYDQWVDFTIHCHWSTDNALGKIQVWKNGVLTVDVTEQTYSSGAIPFNSHEFDWYRTEIDGVNVIYMDQQKLGSTYAIVQPSP